MRTCLIARVGLVAAMITGTFVVAAGAQENLEVETAKTGSRTPIDVFLNLSGKDDEARSQAIEGVRANWHSGDSIMLLESVRPTRSKEARSLLIAALQDLTGENIGIDLNAWYRWIWDQERSLHPRYASYKKQLYSRIDPRFAEYFSDDYDSTIQLDEVRWGGVRRDGIPPLKNPKVLSPIEAIYLADTDVVFGVKFGGHARAYPQKILARHEMVKDEVGGKSINGVYCTLCGSMIVYETEFDGKHYELGTSGFLYRSNKLMYDHETKSMWSTLKGSPVIGPLVGKGISLKPLYVVTTTWGKWKELHPETDVLSLDTGHVRDYREGAAYRSYFATHELMFTVPNLDDRLRNKDEVLVIRLSANHPVAIAAQYLNRNRVHHERIGEQDVVVLTDGTGANRVYQSSRGTKFMKWTAADRVRSADDSVWRVTEKELIRVTDDASAAERLPRVSAHRAFWFGWNAAFPDARLVK